MSKTNKGARVRLVPRRRKCKAVHEKDGRKDSVRTESDGKWPLVM